MDGVASSDDEAYPLLLLADNNFPIGSFVASSGFESFVTHGFFGGSTDNLNTVNFIRDSLPRSLLPFVGDIYQVVTRAVPDRGADNSMGPLDRVCEEIKNLNDPYEATTPNHVTRCVSKSGGVAFLTIYTMGSLPQRCFRRGIQLGEIHSSGNLLTNTD